LSKNITKYVTNNHWFMMKLDLVWSIS